MNIIKNSLLSLFNGISTFVGYCCTPYIMDSPSYNTRQRSIRGSRPNSRVWCASPVDGSHFGRPWCQLHGSGRVCLGTGDPSGLRGPYPKALTLFGGVKLIAWRLRRPSLGECRRGLRYFSKCRARVGCGPAPGPNLKRPCAILIRLVGRKTNTVYQTHVTQSHVIPLA